MSQTFFLFQMNLLPHNYPRWVVVNIDGPEGDGTWHGCDNPEHEDGSHGLVTTLVDDELVLDGPSGFSSAAFDGFTLDAKKGAKGSGSAWYSDPVSLQQFTWEILERGR